jgi:hypothetical protein
MSSILSTGYRKLLRRYESSTKNVNLIFYIFRTIYVNKFITNTINLSMNRELLLHVSAIIHSLSQAAQNILKDIHSGSTQLCQSCIVKHTMQVYHSSTNVQFSQCLSYVKIILLYRTDVKISCIQTS